MPLCVLVHYTRKWYGLEHDFFRAHYPNFHAVLYFVAQNGTLLFLLLLALLAGINFYFTLKRSRRRAMNYVLVFFTFALCFFVIEVGLRIGGVRPNFVGSQKWFRPVGELVTLQGFITDDSGIMRVDSVAIPFINEKIARGQEMTKYDLYSKSLVYEVYAVGNHYINLPDNNFKKNLATLSQKPVKNDLDSAVLWYATHPVNDFGFRSIPFKTYRSTAKKVLLIGDSFTWGHSTSTLTNSFADELLAKGYAVFNVGITGTDPAQYMALAQKFVPLLKPDAVVVNFFMGNDVSYFERKPTPSQPLFYFTNAGNLIACPEGVYFKDAQSAYDHQLLMQRIPTHGDQFNYMCSLTSVGTLSWKVFRRLGWVNTYDPANEEYKNAVAAMRTEQPYSNVQIQKIKDVCETNGARFYLSVFPDINELGMWVYPNDVEGLFEGMEYHVKDFSKNEYDLGNNHMNDLGNYNYALFLDSLLKK